MPDSHVDPSKGPAGSVVLPALSLGFYLVLCFALLKSILLLNAGHFVFSLDDPYIHLALSDQIAAGHYGLNGGEASSPSSSVLWPYLLALFARVSWQTFATLGLNVLAGIGSAVLLGLSVARWPLLNRSLDETTRRVVAAVLLVLVGNLPGLTFLGMEHTLQVFLAICCAYGVVACLRGTAIPWWCLVAAAVGPSVRYESLALTLAVAVALWGQRKKAMAAALLGVAILPLLLFSAYLHHLGLPALPTSVLVKYGSMASQVATSGASAAALDVPVELKTSPVAAKCSYLIRRADHYLSENRALLFVLFATLAGLAYAERDRVRRFALGGAAASVGLHILIGRYGWFYRYEVYAVIFSVLVVLHALHERPRLLLGWYVLGLWACAQLYAGAVRETVNSAHEVYLQQYQMHRFSTDFYQGNVAVNDIGLVSYHRAPNQNVLDLAGLASMESAREKDKSAAWLDAFTREHHVGLVMIYPDWYPTEPASWTRLGQICLRRDPLHLGGRCVDFYATGLDSVPALQEDFAEFVSSLPHGEQVTVAAANGQ